jgi:hypothetical protein
MRHLSFNVLTSSTSSKEAGLEGFLKCTQYEGSDVCYPS